MSRQSGTVDAALRSKVRLMEERIAELETLFERIDVLEEQMQRTERKCARIYIYKDRLIALHAYVCFRAQRS